LDDEINRHAQKNNQQTGTRGRGIIDKQHDEDDRDRENIEPTIDDTEQNLYDFTDLIAILERKVGRLALNGFPRGVEMCHVRG
jgi:hypothetical protein